MDELRWFTLKKSVLLAFCAIDIIVYVVYASAAKYFATKFISDNSKVSQDNNSTTNSALSKDEELVCDTYKFKIEHLFSIKKHFCFLQGDYNPLNSPWVTGGHSVSSHRHHWRHSP